MDPDAYLSELFSNIEVVSPTVGAVIALLFAGFFLMISGFVSASEIAFFSLTSQDIQELDEDNVKDFRIKRFLDKSEYLLATILIVNNLVNVAVVILCNYFISSVIHFGNAEILSFILQTIVLTFLLLLFGEVMPKFYANQNSLKWARKAAHGLAILQKVFYPMATFLVKSTHVVHKHVSKKNINLSMNELSQALEMTQVEANEEKAMLEGIIKFGGKTVEEVMTSRVDMTDVDIRTTFDELIQQVVESGYSRMPVYEGSQDTIKGIIYSKDLLPYIGEKADFEWQKLLRAAYFVPETKMIDDLLEEFRTRKIHMAIVVDEFGGTSGIVTMEDILEEIVGDISDEYDDEEQQYIRVADDTYIFEGKTLLNDFYKITGLDEDIFKDKTEDVETLAGLILGIKEDFPKVKEHIVYDCCDFLVIEIDKRRIIKVKVKINSENISDK